MTKLNPCRFCGEHDLSRLRLQDGAFSELGWGIDPEGNVLRDARGEPYADSAQENGSDDGVFCGVCEVLVPLRVWNASPDWLAKMRASILAADAEFDDDGVWQGQGGGCMTVLQPRVLAAHRLARWLDNPDVPHVAEALAQLTDPATKSLIAKSIRAVSFNEVLDALEPGSNASAVVIADIQRRVFVGARERLQGIFPDDIIEEAFA